MGGRLGRSGRTEERIKVRQERVQHGSLLGTLALRVITWRGFFELSENTYPKGKVESVAVRKAPKDSA